MPENKEKFERDYELMEKLYRKYARDGIRVSRWKQSIRFRIKKALWIIVVGGSRMLKRGIDIIGSLFGLILLSPVFALTALAIKVEDRGPVFFASDRAGKWGKRFKMLQVSFNDP